MAYPAYPAYLDQFYLDIIDISDNIQFGVALHEFPKSNQNQLEWMGEKTKKIKVRCVFSEYPVTVESDLRSDSSKYLPYYQIHYDFLQYLKNPTLVTLHHPQYKAQKGFVQNLSVTHSDTEDYAEITFDFLVENKKFISYNKPIEAQEAADYKATTDKLLSNTNKRKKIAINATRWTAKTQLQINTLTAYANTITSSASSIAASIYYATDLPSQLVESMNFAVDRALQPIIALQQAPSAMINNFVVAATQLLNTFTAAFPDTDVSEETKDLTAACASRVAYESSVVYEQDNKISLAQRKQENQKVFDSNGNFVGGLAFSESMTINELDETCFTVKNFIDTAVQLDREQLALKNQGAIMQKYINQIKLDRERIETEDNTPLQSFHQIALRNGIPYQRAEQLLKLNPRIKNPTFADGSIKVLRRNN